MDSRCTGKQLGDVAIVLDDPGFFCLFHVASIATEASFDLGEPHLDARKRRN